MAVNPLIAYTDQVAGVTPVDDPTEVVGKAPVGVLNEDPFAPRQPSQALLDETAPVAVVTKDDGSGGNFNDDSHLDPGQVVGAPSMGVPLDLPGVPGYVPPPANMQNESWYQSMADAIGAAQDVSEKLGDMFSDPGEEIPMGPLERDTIGMPNKVERTTGNVPTLGDFADPTAVDAPKAQDGGVYVTDDPVARERILRIARGFVGSAAPYNYGGKSFGGASREGMVQAAYGFAGVEDLPALQTAIQSRGDDVPVKNLKPGDLVTWADKQGGLFGHDRVGIFVGNGQLITATHANGFHVMTLKALPGDVNGVRLRKNDRGGVSFAASESGAGAAQAAAQAAIDAVNNIFGGGKKKDDDGKKGGKGGGKHGGGSPSGKGSKYYGSDQDNTNNSSHHYTGIGATK